MHTFKIEMSPEDYWLLRRVVKSADEQNRVLERVADQLADLLSQNPR